MPWFKVDDNLVGNKKFSRIPRAERIAATGLWVTLGSWCARQLTDGLVEDHMISEVGGTPKQAAALVRAGLWERLEGGYQFANWHEYQPSRQTIEDERRASANRQAVARNPELREAIRLRDRDMCRYCGNAVRWNDRRGPLGGTYDHVIPNGPNTLDNLVVCCRGCNSAKGRRTPEQAGMVLLTLRSDLAPDLDPTQFGLKSELVTATVPTRPDPTRPVSVVTSVGASSKHRAPVEEPPDDGSPPTPTQILLAEFVAWLDEHGHDRPPQKVRSDLSAQVRALLNEEIPPIEVLAGLQLWQNKGANLGAGLLPALVHEARSKPRTNGNRRQAETDDMFDQAMARALEKDRKAVGS